MLNLLSNEEMKNLLPTVTVKGQDPKQMVWLTQKDALEYAYAVQAAIIEKLNLEETLIDAARYRWLRRQPNDTTAPRIDVVHWVDADDCNVGDGLRMEQLDVAIDKEMNKEII